MKKNILVLWGLLLAAGCAQTVQPPEQPAPQSSPAAAVQPPVASSALLAPEKAAEQAPAVFKTRFSTTKGDFTVEVHRDWAPHGADRFYNLVRVGYFDDAAFFRAVEGFMVQFGLHGSAEVNAKWREARIPDDAPTGQSNKRGFVTFATAGPNTRTSQIFINYGENGALDSMGFTPFGKVVEGMETLDRLYKGYGDGPPRGMGPDQGRVHMEGNAYLKKEFPLLDYIKTARLVP
ncbi:MAG TPA: peptidylprolyl isomerase [Elusimicrobia bacterium]|nr:peptidylprolyl isomerase [Elusimicrobiota bacterium]HBT61621.1 peptidylprolyl isomerase [Elusimicrobiota bacterium]